MDLVVTRGPGGFVVRQGGPAGPPGPAGSGDVTQAEFDAALALKQDVATAATDTELTDALALKQSTSEKAQANGYASLDASAKVPLAQLTVGSMVYKGTWDVATNTPTLADGTGTTGDTYRVSVAGSRNLGSGSLTYGVADFVLYNGTIWQKVGGSAAGISQAELDGAVATKQPLDPDLTAIAGLTSAADKLPYATGAGTWDLNPFPAFSRLLLQFATDAPATRSFLGVGTGGTTAITANTVTSDYTLVLTDAGKVVEMNAGTAMTITIPTAASVAFANGTQIEVCQLGEGAVTISPHVFVNDTFGTDTHADGTVLTSHTGETGATWTKHTLSHATPTQVIYSNGVRQSGVGSPCLYYASGVPETADYDVDFSFHAYSIENSAATAAVGGRCDPNVADGGGALQTLYLVRLTAGTPGAHVWELFKFVASSATLLGSSPTTITAGEDYDGTLRMNGTTIEVIVGGQTLISVTDPAVAGAGKAAIRNAVTQTAGTGITVNSLSAHSLLLSPGEVRTLYGKNSTVVLRKRPNGAFMLAGDLT